VLGFVLLQCLHEFADLMELAGDADVLRTVGLTLAALDAVVGLAHTWYSTVEADEVVAAQTNVFLVHPRKGQSTLVLAFVVVYEDGGNVNAVGTWHAVFAVIAGDVFEPYDALGHVFV